MGTEIWSLAQAGEPEPELERPSRSSSSRTGESRVTALVSQLDSKLSLGFSVYMDLHLLKVFPANHEAQSKSVV